MLETAFLLPKYYHKAFVHKCGAELQKLEWEEEQMCLGVPCLIPMFLFSSIQRKGNLHCFELVEFATTLPYKQKGIL